MLEFELDKASAVFEHFNTRTEKVNGEKIPAADLRFSCQLPANVLAFFSPTLEAHLFHKATPDLAGEVVKVRYPHLNYPLAVDEEMSGALLKVDYGLGRPMHFPGATINQFRITPMDGGTVTVVFRAQCKPDEQQAGRLYMLQEQAVTITLEPAEPLAEKERTDLIKRAQRVDNFG